MIEYKNNNMNKIPELRIGKGELFKKFEINLGWKKFKIIIRW